MSFVTEDDPFKDPSLHAASTPTPTPTPTPQRTPPANVPDTLAVGRNASLTLGTDSLVVLGTDPVLLGGLEERWLMRLQMKRYGIPPARAAAASVSVAVRCAKLSVPTAAALTRRRY